MFTKKDYDECDKLGDLLERVAEKGTSSSDFFYMMGLYEGQHGRIAWENVVVALSHFKENLPEQYPNIFPMKEIRERYQNGFL